MRFFFFFNLSKDFVQISSYLDGEHMSCMDFSAKVVNVLKTDKKTSGNH